MNTTEQTSTATPSLNVEQLFTRSFKLLYENMMNICGMALLVSLLHLAFSIGMASVGIGYSILVEQMFMLFLQAIIIAGVSHMTLNALAGKTQPRAQTWAIGLGALIATLPLAILFTLSQIIGLLSLVIPFLLLTVFFWPIMTVAAIEHTGIKRSFQRSLQLTKNSRWTLFGLLLMVIVFKYLAFSVFILFLKGSSTLIEMGIPDYRLSYTGLTWAIFSTCYIAFFSAFVGVLTTSTYRALCQLSPK